ncbi:MAG TPA: glycoside hydrolase family 88 protein [Opitutaceae bacterium]|nr:glycoside hydrolase family 88 protein [Opitutaceae bacterium]
MNRVLLPCLAALTFSSGALVATAQTPAPSATPAASGAAPAAPEAGVVNMGAGPVNYPMPYAPPAVADIKAALDRIRDYLETATPDHLIDRTTNQTITDFSHPNPNATTPRSTFQLVSYEWGVTYAGMLRAAETTGDARFSDFTAKRFKLIAEVAPMFRADAAANPPPVPGAGGPGGGAGGAGGRGGFGRGNPVRPLVAPRSLDDSGSMGAALIKAQRAGIVGTDLRPLIDPLVDWIANKQFRFPDGTLARNRPYANTLWLDDLFMGVPALAQMGKLTGDRKYFDDAVKQVLQFSERMFVKEKGLFMHGWVQEMDDHPAFYWGRANGWAIMTMSEVLDVLPEDHPGRAKILELYRAHVHGLAACQSADGLWHQLLDRSDTYLETSASAIFVYAIAHGINRGWIGAPAHGAMAILGWNAVAKKINDKGQVEGTCVGTDMGFEPTFYSFRPTSVMAAHGYGPVLLAGAEMIALRNGPAKDALINLGSMQMQRPPSFF